MANMKISKTAVIDSLKQRVVEFQAETEAHKQEQEEWERSNAAIEKAVLKWAKANIEKADMTYYGYYNAGGTVTLRFELPVELQRKPHATVTHSDRTSEIADLERNIRLLEMSESEYVGISVWNKLSHYL